MATQPLEAVLADLETVPGRATPVARVTSSGQAALLIAVTLVVTPARRRIVVVRPCYGGTEALLAGPLGNLGVRSLDGRSPGRRAATTATWWPRRSAMTSQRW